jgi:hypothetical protein
MALTSRRNIVTAQAPKRNRRKKQPVAYDGPRIVVAKKAEPWQRPPWVIDPEEEARLDAFIARMMRPPTTE